jgi:hypothetical protein
MRKQKRINSPRRFTPPRGKRNRRHNLHHNPPAEAAELPRIIRDLIIFASTRRRLTAAIQGQGAVAAATTLMLAEQRFALRRRLRMDISRDQTLSHEVIYHEEDEAELRALRGAKMLLENHVSPDLLCSSHRIALAVAGYRKVRCHCVMWWCVARWRHLLVARRGRDLPSE